jgi:L-amino acid N-acyltransferase YncA
MPPGREADQGKGSGGTGRFPQQPVVRPMCPEDWPAVSAIYAEGIATRNATFDTEPPPWETWDAAHLAEHRLVVVEGDDVLGWAALAPVSDRCCYAGVTEDSIYLAERARGRGVGRALLTALIEQSEDAGIWTIETRIFPENQASITLHERCGFRRIGTHERRGCLDGVWRDVVLLERRSSRV